MFINLLIWISCFCSWASMVVISKSSTLHDKRFACIYIGSLCVLILIKLTFCKIRKKDIKKCILDLSIPVLHCLFFICHSNIMYGYGNTMGIIGHEEVIGLFSVNNVSYNMAFILMNIMYAILWFTMILKHNVSDGTITLPNNRGALAAIIIVIAVEIIGICIFISTNELSLLYLFSIAFFWIFKFITRLISFIITELKDE